MKQHDHLDPGNQLGVLLWVSVLIPQRGNNGARDRGGCLSTLESLVSMFLQANVEITGKGYYLNHLGCVHSFYAPNTLSKQMSCDHGRTLKSAVVHPFDLHLLRIEL